MEKWCSFQILQLFSSHFDLLRCCQFKILTALSNPELRLLAGSSALLSWPGCSQAHGLLQDTANAGYKAWAATPTSEWAKASRQSPGSTAVSAHHVWRLFLRLTCKTELSSHQPQGCPWRHLSKSKILSLSHTHTHPLSFHPFIRNYLPYFKPWILSQWWSSLAPPARELMDEPGTLSQRPSSSNDEDMKRNSALLSS